MLHEPQLISLVRNLLVYEEVVIYDGIGTSVSKLFERPAKETELQNWSVSSRALLGFYWFEDSTH